MQDERERIQKYLSPDESIVWSGRPDPAVFFARADAYLVPFSVVFLGFVTVIWVTSWSRTTALITVFFGIIVLAGLYQLAGRFIFKRWKNSRTSYAVTNHRILVAVGDKSLRETPVKTLQAITRLRKDGQHIDITFGPIVPGFRWNPSNANTGMDFMTNPNEPLAFYDVAEPAAVVAALDRVRS